MCVWRSANVSSKGREKEGQLFGIGRSAHTHTHTHFHILFHFCFFLFLPSPLFLRICLSVHREKECPDNYSLFCFKLITFPSFPFPSLLPDNVKFVQIVWPLNKTGMEKFAVKCFCIGQWMMMVVVAMMMVVEVVKHHHPQSGPLSPISNNGMEYFGKNARRKGKKKRRRRRRKRRVPARLLRDTFLTDSTDRHSSDVQQTE